jgi:HAD superfamily hydrolase (TIGR01490 family)
MPDQKRPLEGAGGPAALFDFDGTLIHGDSLTGLLGFILRRHPQAAGELLGLAMAGSRFVMGQLTRAGLKERALAVLKHVPPAQRASFFEAFRQEWLSPRLLAPGLQRIAWHREQGHQLFMVSASVDLYLRPLAANLGFDHLVCTLAALDPSPRLVSQNCRGEEKVRRVLEDPSARGLRWDESWAYGDSLSDLPLLQRCAHPVAVRPRSDLRRHAIRMGWEILQW